MQVHHGTGQVEGWLRGGYAPGEPVVLGRVVRVWVVRLLGLGLALGLVGVGGPLLVRDVGISTRTATTSATVVRAEPFRGGDTARLTVTFRTLAGPVTARLEGPRLPAGATVPVEYDRDHPDRARMHGSSTRLIEALCLVGGPLLGAFFLALAPGDFAWRYRLGTMRMVRAHQRRASRWRRRRTEGPVRRSPQR